MCQISKNQLQKQPWVIKKYHFKILTIYSTMNCRLEETEDNV